MTIITHPEIDTRVPPPEEDPFRYGWRFLKHTLPDGSLEFEQVPLTLEDVLHPQVGDFIVLTSEHHLATRYLSTVVDAQFKDDPGAVVLSDTRIAWDRGGVKPMGPDLALIFGVKAIRNWATFDCKEEGTRPVLVIEVTSPDTGSQDVNKKVELYERAEIPWYVIVDYDVEREKPPYIPNWTPPPPTVFGYRLGAQGYQRLPIDDRGWIWMEPAGMWIGIQEGRVQCYDQAGSPIRDYLALAAALEESKRELAREESERDREESERAREESERVREESQRELARERAGRLEAEERLAALEARLRELGLPDQ